MSFPLFPKPCTVEWTMVELNQCKTQIMTYVIHVYKYITSELSIIHVTSGLSFMMDYEHVFKTTWYNLQSINGLVSGSMSRKRPWSSWENPWFPIATSRCRQRRRGWNCGDVGLTAWRVIIVSMMSMHTLYIYIYHSTHIWYMIYNISHMIYNI